MRNVNWFGLVVSAVCVAVSLAFSIHYGIYISEDAMQAAIYPAIGIAAVTWEVVGLHRIAHLWRAGRTVACYACLVGFMLAAIVTIQYELGFLAVLFEGRASIGESKAGERTALELERANLQEQIKKAGVARPLEAVRGDLAGVEALQASADRANAAAETEAARKGCGPLCAAHRADYTASMTRLSAAPAIEKLRAELGVAEGIARVQARIEAVNARLKPLAGAKSADARATYTAKLFDTTPDVARLMLSLVIIAFLGSGRWLATFTFMDPPTQELQTGSVMHADQPVDRTGDRLETVTFAQESAPVSARPAGHPFADTDEPLSPGMLADMQDWANHPELFDRSSFDEDEDDDGVSADQRLAEFEMAQELERLDAINAGRPEPKPARAPLVIRDLAHRQQVQLVERFVGDCLIISPDDRKAVESGKTLYDAFTTWCGDLELKDRLDHTGFGVIIADRLEDRGCEKKRSDGAKYYGVRVKPALAHRMAFEASKQAEMEKQPQPATRLGSFGHERRALVVGGLDGAPAGSA